MFVRSHESGWVLHAPAKINLALEVLGRRQDGYHDLETLLTPVRCFDTLIFRPADSLRFSVESHLPGTPSPPADDNNLVVRAVKLLAERAGCEPTGNLHLIKRIPSEAGLGGGSSDAAAALVGANLAWRLGYTREQLSQVASELGADVPFFLGRGAAIGRSRGDVLHGAAIPLGMPVVIVRPDEGLSTPRVFSGLGLERGAVLSDKPNRCGRLAEGLRQGVPIGRISALVKNTLQPVAERMVEAIARIAHAVAKLPVAAHQMTGSGSSYFAVCHSWRNALRTAASLRQMAHINFVCATVTCP